MNGDFGKIEAYKENWYALAACMCSQKVKSRAQAFSLKGIKITKEPDVKISKKMEFDKAEIEALYKKLGSIRQVSIKVGCNQTTLWNFFKKAGIETLEVRPKIVDKYDKQAINKLQKEGKNAREIAEVLNYSYTILCRYLRENATH